MPLLIAIVALFCLTSGLGAQEPVPLEAGARVRVTVEGPGRRVRTGTLHALGRDTLHLRAGSAPVAVPLAAIVQLERSRGRRPGVAGGVLGFVLGAAAGGAAGCAANRDDYGVFCGGQSDATVFTGAALGGAVGAALGAWLLPRERWAPVALGQIGAPPPGGR